MSSCGDRLPLVVGGPSKADKVGFGREATWRHHDVSIGRGHNERIQYLADAFSTRYRPEHTGLVVTCERLRAPAAPRAAHGS